MNVGHRVLGVLVGLLATTLVLSACGNDNTEGSDDKGTLTLYNAQHEDLMKLLAHGFTKETGIKVEMRNGDDFEMANQIVQEGDKSPADVFVTENSPAMTLVANKGGFAAVGDDALDNIPAKYSPTDKSWVGFAARSTVLAYNTDMVKTGDLPASILDLAEPKWKNKVGMSPSGADFQAIVSSVLQLKGEKVTLAWLKGLKDNAKVYDGNSTVMKAVNSGDIEAGVIYHYYWFKDRNEAGANSDKVKLDYFGNQDPGAFVSVSGAGILKASDNQKQAQEFVEYLTGKEGQGLLADSAAMEYSINPDAATNKQLKPLDELDAPDIDLTALNGPKVVDLMQKAGLL